VVAGVTHKRAWSHVPQHPRDHERLLGGRTCRMCAQGCFDDYCWNCSPTEELDSALRAWEGAPAHAALRAAARLGRDAYLAALRDLLLAADMGNVWSCALAGGQGWGSP
jgi:hypothetical protein